MAGVVRERVVIHFNSHLSKTMQLSHISIGHVQIPMRWIASRNRRKTIALKVTSA